MAAGKPTGLPQVRGKIAASPLAQAQTVTKTRPLPLQTRTAAEPEPDLTFLVVMHRAILGDLGRLADCIGSVRDQRALNSARAGAVGRYTVALLATIRARHESESEILWPVVAAVAGASVDLMPLADDHQAIAAAISKAREPITLHGAEPAALSALPTCVADLRNMLGEHIADEQAQVFPAMRRYMTAGGYRWCEEEILRTTSVPQRMFTLPWLARYAQPDERRRLLAVGGWQQRLLLTAARPGYSRLERNAFGRHPPATTVGRPP